MDREMNIEARGLVKVTVGLILIGLVGAPGCSPIRKSVAETPIRAVVPEKVKSLLTPHDLLAVYHVRRAHIDHRAETFREKDMNKEWDYLVRFRTRTVVTDDMGSYEPSKDAVVLGADTDAPRLAFVSREENDAYHRIELIDFDKDGVDELVQHRYIGGGIFRFADGQFATEIPVQQPKLDRERFESFRRPRWEFCDVDSDGVRELIIVGSDDSMVFKYSGGQFRYVECVLKYAE